jgi:hypothetical protein
MGRPVCNYTCLVIDSGTAGLADEVRKFVKENDLNVAVHFADHGIFHKVWATFANSDKDTYRKMNAYLRGRGLTFIPLPAEYPDPKW